MVWYDLLHFDIPIFGLVWLFAKGAVVLAMGLYLASEFSLSAAAVRHRLRVSTMLALALLPILTWVVPKFYVPLFSTNPDAYFSTADPVIAFALAGYLLVALGKGLILLGAVLRIGWITSRSKPAPRQWKVLGEELAPKANISMRCSASVSSPVSWGSFWPVILLPVSTRWSESDRRMVFLHEWAHIQRGDWLAQLLSQLVAILYWPVPGIRSALAQLSLEAEQACDDFVIRGENCPANYAALLLRQAHLSKVPATLAFAHCSELSLRIKNICTNSVSHSVTFPDRRWLFIICILMIFPLAVMQPSILAPDLVFPGVFSASPVDWSPVVRPDYEVPPILKPVRPAAALRHPVALNIYNDERVVVDTQYDDMMMVIERPVVSLEMYVGSMGRDLDVYPVYPSRAIRRGIEGYVRIQYDIDQLGYVINPRIISAQPAGVFDASVLQVVTGLKVEPQLIQGNLVELRDVESTFRFQLLTPQKIKGSRPP